MQRGLCQPVLELEILRIVRGDRHEFLLNSSLLLFL
jgi:hypothetical protein